METANLQIEGMLLAVAALVEVLERKGTLSRSEVIDGLRAAEAAAVDDPQRPDLRPANVKAITFPIRFLIAAVERGPGEPLTYSSLTTAVGRSED